MFEGREGGLLLELFRQLLADLGLQPRQILNNAIFEHADGHLAFVVLVRVRLQLLNVEAMESQILFRDFDRRFSLLLLLFTVRWHWYHVHGVL